MNRYAFLLCCLLAGNAHADPSNWEFNITPYLWLGGIHSTYDKVAPPGPPPLSGETHVGSILPYLSKFPVMGAGEVRYGRIGLNIDFFALSANFGTALRTPPFLAGQTKVTDIQSSVVLSYRVIKDDDQVLDLGVGARGWSIDTKLKFVPATLKNHSAFVDPLIAFRYHHALPARFGVTIIGQLGGGTNARLSYQVVGTLDYEASKWLILHGGYRHSYFDYRGTPIQFNATLSGPLIAATFRF